VDRSIYEPAQVIETNVTGTFVLLQVARQMQIARFLHVSTDEVYGDMAAAPLPMRIRRCSPAVHIPPSKRPRISWFAHARVPMAFPASSPELRTTTAHFNSRKNSCP
jgi:hypothetical protein